MDALDYLKKLENEGYESYIVGGYVRDKLLGIETTDIDIATSARPKTIAKIFNLNQGDNLGSINIKYKELNIDITTFRRESNYFGHRPKKVSYVKDLLTDLKRRDFTINTICMNSDGEIIDLLNGRKDLENKEIKVVGKIKKKFTEDPLRMLRALRFSITADLNIGEEELIFILNNKNLFDEISYERKKEEVGKILISENCIQGFKFLDTLNILEVLEIEQPEKIVYVHDYIGMWAQLKFNPKYPFNKVEMTRMKNIRAILENKKIDADTLFKYGLYDSLVAGDILGIDRSKINAIYKKMNLHSIDELKISGKTIKEVLNISDSPKIRDIKRDLIIKLVSGNLTNEENCLIDYIKKKWK